MQKLPADIARRIDTLAADRLSGASELLGEAIAILLAARTEGADMALVARALCRAQPTMAPMWNAAAAALSNDPGQLDRFAQRVRRAPAALARYAVGLFADETDPRTAHGALHVVTLSSSGSVQAAVLAIQQHRPVRVSCSESRPALEGRRLAATLAGSGIPVACYADAALAAALADADAVLVGADAVTPTHFLNKAGTYMLATTAQHGGVPVYVVTTADRFVTVTVAERLVIRSGSPDDVWASAPTGVSVQNPYFEPVPLEMATGFITDRGVLGVGMIADVCAGAPTLPETF